MDQENQFPLLEKGFKQMSALLDDLTADLVTRSAGSYPLAFATFLMNRGHKFNGSHLIVIDTSMGLSLELLDSANPQNWVASIYSGYSASAKWDNFYRGHRFKIQESLEHILKFLEGLETEGELGECLLSDLNRKVIPLNLDQLRDLDKIQQQLK